MAKRLTNSQKASLLLICGALLVIFWQGDKILNPAFMEREISLADSRFSMTVLELDSADSILISCEGDYVLVDGGEDADSKTVTSFLSSQGVKELDLVIATHPHTDHIGGLDEVMSQFSVNRILTPRIPDSMVPTTREYTRFLSAITEKGIPVTAAEPMKTLTVGAMTFTVLAPLGNDYTNLNDFSAVVRLEYGECSFLLTGDAESASESDLLDDPRTLPLLDCDVLKVAHHGGKASTKKKFAEAVTPKIAVIPSRTGEDDGDTYADVTDRLEAVGAKVYATRDYGSITVVSDGKSVGVRTGRKPE